jgi:hypothetical protein
LTPSYAFFVGASSRFRKSEPLLLTGCCFIGWLPTLVSTESRFDTPPGGGGKAARRVGAFQNGGRIIAFVGFSSVMKFFAVG